MAMTYGNVTAMSMHPTDEPAVTDATRFWLTWSVQDRTAERERTGRFVRYHYGVEHTYRAEVSEATYRAAHRAAFGGSDDITEPLDDWWWTSSDVASGHMLDWAVHVRRGGRIDWEG